MGLIELCLLSVLSPQQPEATGALPHADKPAAESPAPAESVQEQEPADAKQRLQAAEKAGTSASADELLSLASCDNAKVAARAAWLMAHSENPDHARNLHKVVKQSPHAEARVHAMKYLLKTAQPKSAKLAVDSLSDDDRRVRTLAVQLLGKLRNPLAIDSLVALVDVASTSEQAGSATDVQAAVLALTDFDATDQLLRIATSIHDGNAVDTGTALTYAFQTMSPKLDADKETTLLVAVLGHRETTLRRYAITRLAELGSKTAASALEGRLAVEGAELRPLVENALAQIRHDHQGPPTDEVERAKTNAKALWARFSKWWNGLEPLHQGLVAGAPVLFIVIILLLRRSSKRRAAREEALATAAMVQPSDEYYEDQEGDEYEDDGDYEEGSEEDGDFDEEYEDGDYEEGAAPQASADDDEEYDTSGWQEDGEDETLLAEGGLEDEQFR